MKRGRPETLRTSVMDLYSYRTAKEMGYEVHSDGLWWPLYDESQQHPSDFDYLNKKPRRVWPTAHIQAQRKRLRRGLYRSPGGFKTKIVEREYF